MFAIQTVCHIDIYEKFYYKHSSMSYPPDLYSQIGKRIKELRKEKGFTQSRLAEIVSLTRTSITNIEKGRQKLLVHTLWDLADAIGVHPKSFFPQDNPNHSDLNNTIIPSDLSKKEMNWFKAVTQGGSKHGNKKKDH